MSTPTLRRASEVTSVQTGPVSSIPRNKRGQPYAVPRTGGKPMWLSRASSAGEPLEDTSNLGKWQVRQALLGAATKPDLLDGILDLDLNSKEGKTALDKIGEQAQAIAGSYVKRDRGTYLHSMTELVDKGHALPADIDPRAAKQMGEYMLATLDFKVRDVERFVVCIEPPVKCAGTVDRFVEYSGPGPDGEHFEGLITADVKTGSVSYPMKMACQLSVYSRGLYYDPRYFPVDTTDEKAFEAWKKRVFTEDEALLAYAGTGVRQDWGVIIHMPSDGDETTLYWVDLNLGREALLLSYEVRDMRNRAKRLSLRPFVTEVTDSGLASSPEGV